MKRTLAGVGVDNRFSLYRFLKNSDLVPLINSGGAGCNLCAGLVTKQVVPGG